jgi:hypothetical protein
VLQDQQDQQVQLQPLQDQQVQLVQRVHQVLVLQFLVLTEALVHYKQLSQQEILVMVI